MSDGFEWDDSVENDNDEIQEEDDFFESGPSSVYKFIRTIKKDSGRNLYNRLRSILRDSVQVENIRGSSALPICANLRCGLWYCQNYDTTCYFKSTDGHVNQWKFSLTRINVHIIRMISSRGGIIIIDSTRKGKRYPDSFSRTIPIWACTINRALKKLREQKGITSVSSWDTELHSPAFIPHSERATVDKVVDKHVEVLLNSGADLGEFIEGLKKPLRCVWICPQNVHSVNTEDFEALDYAPIYCFSVSDSELDNQLISNDIAAYSFSDSYTYIQGAGDDHESWSQGLTPSVFWEHKDEILGNGSCAGIEERVADAVKKSRESSVSALSAQEEQPAKIYKIGETGLGISAQISAVSSIGKDFDAIVLCSQKEVDTEFKQENVLVLHAEEGKKDKNKLSRILPQALEFAQTHLAANHRILFVSPADSSVSLCLCLATLLKYYDLQGNKLSSPRSEFNKDIIKRFSLFLDKFHSETQPARVMMNDINRYFMTPASLQPRALKN